MASRMITVVPKTKYSFKGAVGGKAVVQLGPRAIMNSDWVSGILNVVVFSKNFNTATDGTVGVGVLNTFIPPESPQTVFSADFETPLALVSIEEDTPANGEPGSLLVQPITGIGAMVSVFLTCDQGSTSDIIDVELSVTLVGRDA